jgi:lysine-specific demethylase 3
LLIWQLEDDDIVLGPKMYIAYGSVEDDRHHGSTKLHLDMTDAVNIMVWASGAQGAQSNYALWRIFPQAASPLICNYLREHAGFVGPGHPIHSQSFYFTESMLKDLEAQHGIRPYTIRQSAGEAVFIPAGCAHQVCTLTQLLRA